MRSWRAAFVAVALASLFLGGCAEEPHVGPARHLLIVSLDTVRADHLAVYGYERETAPGVSALAARGAVFSNAFSHDTNTNPAHTSLFTSLHPHQHGSRANGQRLAPGVRTLAQLLADMGFATGGFVSGATMKDAASGLSRGFDIWEDRFDGKRRDGAETVDLARRWLREQGGRVFLFLHLYDAHGRYLPQGDYRDLFQSDEPGPRLDRVPKYQRLLDERGELERSLNVYVDAYDEMIRYADDQVARLLGDFDLDETLVVLLSDHGETLGERYHVLDHGAQVFDEQIRIPLIFAGPDVPVGRHAATVRMIDVLPTLFTLLGLERPSDLPVQGRDLAPLMRGEEGGPEPVFASARAAGRRHRDRLYDLDRSRRILSLRDGGWKVVLYPGEREDYVELYDLSADPGERVNLAETRPEVRERMLERLARWREDGASSPAPEVGEGLSPELRDQLEALGYVDE